MNTEQKKNTTSKNTWLAVLVLSLLVNFGLGLTLVWVNTQRTNLAYRLQKAQREFSEAASYTAKLEIERDRFLSPYYLERKARELGMRNAQPGQIRRLQ